MERLISMIEDKALAATKASVQAIPAAVESVLRNCQCVVPAAVGTQKADIAHAFKPEQLP